MSTNINTNSPTVAPVSSGSQTHLGSKDQVNPGILQLAFALSDGIGKQTVALAEMNKHLNTYGDKTLAFAQEQYAIGNQMVTVGQVLTITQWVVTGAIFLASLGTAIAPAAAAIAADAASATLAEKVSSAVTVVTQGVQTMGSVAGGGMQTYKGYLDMQNQELSSATRTYSNVLDNESKALNAGFDSTGTNSQTVSTMLQSYGRVINKKVA
jgi:hypothetical protein